MTRFILVGNGRPVEEVYLSIRRLGGEVSGIYSDPESRSRLQALGLNPESASELLKKSVADQFRNQEIDWLLNVQSKIIFPSEMLRAPALGAINFHPGPLPEGAGLTAHEWAIILGEKTFGATLHYMTEELDGGPIIARRDFDITESDTGLTLLARAWRVGTELLCDLLPLLIAREKPPGLPQERSRFRYFPGRPPYGSMIDFGWPARRALNFIRALTYHPLRSPSGPPCFVLDGESYAAHRATMAQSHSGDVLAGTIVEVTDQGIRVAAGENETIWIQNILKENAIVAAGPYFQSRGVTAGHRCRVDSRERAAQI